MTTTRSYGSWVRATGHSAFSLDGEVADALLAGADVNDYSDEQIEAVAAAYRDAINEALPEGVALCGDEFYGPADADTPDLAEIVDGVDFWAIAERVLVPVDAATLAALIADLLGTIPGPLRDGAYSIDTSEVVDATGVWRLHVGDDPSPDAPHGISWAIDSPDERGVDCGGWEELPGHLAAAEAATLAASLTRQADLTA